MTHAERGIGYMPEPEPSKVSASRPRERLASVSKDMEPSGSRWTVDRRDHPADVTVQHVPVGVPPDAHQPRQTPNCRSHPCRFGAVRHHVADAPVRIDILGFCGSKYRVERDDIAMRIREHCYEHIHVLPRDRPPTA